MNQKDPSKERSTDVTAKDILGNPDYIAISYSGYRLKSREFHPTVEQVKEDMKILAAMDIKVIRMYDVKSEYASNVLQAIDELMKDDSTFEMYVMLGAWIDCKNPRTQYPDHNSEDLVENTKEIERAIKLTKKYPHIVKVIAVGNEAMVKWATGYYVQANVILKYVKQLQKEKAEGNLPKDLWITSSDNFASWGGGSPEYHTEDLTELINSVDFISVHSYPMHDTHYNPDFWGVSEEESQLSKKEMIDVAMQRALDYIKNQYEATKEYMVSLGVNKPVHIGETGWASFSNGFYGSNGSRATDEYKEAIYHQKVRDWTNSENISCFYFEAFDEIWKDAKNPGGSENHFGLFDVHGNAKYALWDLVDAGVFKGLHRGNRPIQKTFNGDLDSLMNTVQSPPIKAFELME